MSDSQTQPYQPTPSDSTSGRRKFPLTGLLVVLLAGAALAAALWYAGGTDALARLAASVGSLAGGSPSAPSQVQKPAVAPAPSGVATSQASALPPEAQQRMFAEQVESRQALSELVAGSIVSLKTGPAHQGEDSATVPLTAVFKDGSSLGGTLTLRRFADKWYFFSLARSSSKQDASGPSDSVPSAFDSDVVATITQQQAMPGTQEMLTQGMLEGGYRTVKVDRVTMGPRTATIDVTMADGTEPAAKGRLVAISKTDGTDTYWFVARFEKR